MSDAQHTLDLIARTRLVAVIRLPDLSIAEPLTRALLDGGIKALEFTMTNRDSIDVIADLSRTLPDFANGEAVIGAGTVTNSADATACINAGAQFIVSPTTKFPVIDTCKAAGVPIMPGAFTPTEIEAAWDAGASVVKVFPATTLGPAYFKNVLAPLPHIKLMPTGGVNQDNMGDYFKNGAVAVGVGGNLLDKAAIAKGDWDIIKATAETYIQAAQNA